MTAPDHDVVVVGAGFSGIGASIRLSRAGFDDHVLIDEADDVGGTWQWNRYPGVALDIPAFSYQFSFERRTDWSRVYAPGRELLAYARHCADKYGVRDRVRFGTRVERAAFDDESHLWRLSTSAGDEVTARFVVGATGVFTQPKPPDIPGIAGFGGATLHTARWDEGLDLRGKRVAIIGTGASAVQVIPEIAPIVEHLTVFQRTPIWCLPKPDRPVPPVLRRLMRSVPFGDLGVRLASQLFVEATFPLPAHFNGILPMAKLAERAGRAHLREQVRDPELRAKLTPSYAVGCKRPSFHNSYLATFNRENVTLETDPIERITKTGIRTTQGALHEADVLVLATGFKVFEPGNIPPFPIRGSGGVELEAFWQEHRLQAYEGVSVPGFPNYFAILGPYGYNGSSYFTLSSCWRPRSSAARRSGCAAARASSGSSARWPPAGSRRGSRRRGARASGSAGCAASGSRSTSTATGTCRSGRRRPSRPRGAARGSTSTTTASRRPRRPARTSARRSRRPSARPRSAGR